MMIIPRISPIVLAVLEIRLFSVHHIVGCSTLPHNLDSFPLGGAVVSSATLMMLLLEYYSIIIIIIIGSSSSIIIIIKELFHHRNNVKIFTNWWVKLYTNRLISI